MADALCTLFFFAVALVSKVKTAPEERFLQPCLPGGKAKAHSFPGGEVGVATPARLNASVTAFASSVCLA